MTVPQSPPPPMPTGPTSEQRNWAVGAHLSAVAASAILGLAVLGPLAVYLIKKDEDPFTAQHSREALNFQLTWLIGGFVAVILAVVLVFVTIGIGLVVFIPAAIGFFVAWVVFMVQGAMAASRGQHYRYPLTIRMVS